MRLILNSNYAMTADTLTLGYVGETNARTISIANYIIDGADMYKLRFGYADGVTYDVDVTGGTYTIDGSVMRNGGYVGLQLLACKLTDDKYQLVKKSNIVTMRICDSLSDDIAPIPTYEQSVEALEKVNSVSGKIFNEIKTNTENINNITSLTGTIVDLSDKITWIGNGIVISASNMPNKGNISTSSTQKYCDYLDVGGYSKLTYNRCLSTNTSTEGVSWGLSFYDKDKKWITGQLAINRQLTAGFIETTIDIPQNAKYIRASMWSEYSNTTDYKISVISDGAITLKLDELETNVKKYNEYKSEQIHFYVNSVKSINPLISGADGTTTSDTCLDTTVIQKMNAVLSLPTNYSKNGKPSSIIMLCHGWGGTVSETQWCENKSDFLSFVNYLNNHGYAVFDVDATDGLYHSPKPDLGCPQLVNAYMQAYKYIVSNYNVEQMFSVYALSFGSFTGMNILQLYGNSVKSAIISGVRQSLASVYNDHESFRIGIAEKYGFTDKAGTTYETDKMQPYDTYANILTINETDYLPKKYPPIKFIFGDKLLDNECWTQSWRVINALKNSGNLITARSVAGADHNHVCYAVSDGLKEEVVNWFGRFNQ